MTIYQNEDDPLIVDSTSKNDFFPTIYTVQMFPKFVKTVIKMKQGVE